MKYLVFFSLLFVSAIAFAGEAVFTGNGRVASPIEFIQVVATIKSECYPTVKAAVAANALLSKNVFDEFSAAIDPANDKDGVFSNGGIVKRFSRYTNGKLTCDGSFEKTTTITLKTSRIDDFKNLFQTIQGTIYGIPAESQSKSEPISFITLGEPSSEVYYTTLEGLESTALANAVEDAKSEIKAVSEVSCGIGEYSILYIKEKSGSQPVAYGRARFAESSPANALGSPISFDQKWVNKTVELTISYTGGRCN